MCYYCFLHYRIIAEGSAFILKLLFLTNVPSPYRVDFFNELGKLCDLTVVFEKKTSDERDKSWQNYRFESFKGIFLKGISVRTDAALCFGVIKHVKNGNFDKIICTNFSSPTGMLAINYMKRKGIDYWLECDGATAKDGRGFKEKLKTYLITGAAGYYSTSESSDEYYKAYGAPEERIHRYPFTSLRDCDILPSLPAKEAKEALRKKLNITEDNVMVSVGRFSYMGGYGKGYDTIIKSACKLPNAGIYIIGGEPTEEFLKMQQEFGAQNVHFLPHKSKEELKEYYMASDVFTLMSRGEAWGLVVNEAMAMGLPVITTDKCVAGLELVEHGANGFIVGSEDLDSFTVHAKQLLNNKELCLSMGQKSLEKIKKYTIEEMARSHVV